MNHCSEPLPLQRGALTRPWLWHERGSFALVVAFMALGIFSTLLGIISATVLNLNKSTEAFRGAGTGTASGVEDARMPHVIVVHGSMMKLSRCVTMCHPYQPFSPLVLMIVRCYSRIIVRFLNQPYLAIADMLLFTLPIINRRQSLV